MALAWVACPVIVDNGLRRPLVATFADPGRPDVIVPEEDGFGNLTGGVTTRPAVLAHNSAISSGLAGEDNDWCLSLVAGAALDALAHPDVDDLIGAYAAAEHPRFLDATPLGDNWTLRRRDDLRAALARRREIPAELDDAKPLWLHLMHLGRVHQPGFDPRAHSAPRLPVR